MDGLVVSAMFFASFSALFSIMNPFSTASVFISITRSDSFAKRTLMAQKACFTAACVLVLFAITGGTVLMFFSITIDAFRIAGGILVAMVGYTMLKSTHNQYRDLSHEQEVIRKDDISIIPLAIPMMSGPGAITTAIMLMQQAGDDYWLGQAVIFAIVSVCVITYVLLRWATPLMNKLGETGKDIIEKIMGIIVMVIGVQFIINGVSGVLINIW